MKPLLLLLFVVWVARPAWADDADEVAEPGGLNGLVHLLSGKHAAAAAPKVDPKRIINASSAFLKDREPDMTAEEEAMYEKMSTMLSTNPDLAVKMLQAMMGDKEPPSPAFDLILGNAYYAANEYDQAEAMYRTALKRYPDFIRAWSDLGILCYAAGRFSEAVTSLAKAIDLGDRDSTTYGLMGYSLEKQGDAVSAEMAYLQAVGSDPNNRDWKEGLLRIYIGGNQFGRAEQIARSLVETNPSASRYWFDYAGILLSEGRKAQATIVLDEAVEAGAAGPDEMELLGDLYAEQDMAPEAVAVYRRLLASSPAQGERKLLQFARALLAEGHLDEAERALDNAPAGLSDHNQAQWLRLRADLRLAQRRWLEARKDIQALLARNPLDGPALLVLGRTYLGEGNWPRAEFAFEAASRIPGSAYDADLELAKIELQGRHFDEAASYLGKALALQRTEAVETAYAHLKALAPPDAASE